MRDGYRPIGPAPIREHHRCPDADPLPWRCHRWQRAICLGQERGGDHDLEPDRGHHLDEYGPAAGGPGGQPTHFIYYAFTHLAIQRVNGITERVRALPVGHAREHERVARGRRGCGSASHPEQLLPGAGRRTRRAPRRVPGGDTRQQAQGARHRLRRGRGQPHHRAPHQRRPARDGDHSPALVAGDWEPTRLRSCPSPGPHGSAGSGRWPSTPTTPSILGTRPRSTPRPMSRSTTRSSPWEVEQRRADAGAEQDGALLLGRRHRPHAGGPATGYRSRLDISDSARLFAAVETSIADTAGTVWNAKLQYMWWRPVTAIQRTDDNDATVGDATWLPFITTPPYPDWPSGLCGWLAP